MKILFYSLVFALILMTVPLYSQWYSQIIPGDIDVTLGIDFINQNHGVMGGWHITTFPDIEGNAYFTTNGGINWIDAIVPDSMRVMVGTQMINNNIAYGAGAYNLSNINYKQDDIHNTQKISSRTNKYSEKIGMNISRQEEYRGYFIESNDGGLSWHPKGSFEDSVYYLVGLHFLDMQTGFVLATGPSNNTFAAILKTTDGGNNWNYVYDLEAFLFLNDIKFYDQMNGIVVGTFDDMTNHYAVVLKTTDAGNNWNKIILPSIASVNKVTYLTENTLLLNGINLAGQAVIFKSIDGGISWVEYRNYGDFVFTNDVNSLTNQGKILITGQYESTGELFLFIDISTDNGVTWSSGLHQPYQDYYPMFSSMLNEMRWYITGTITSSIPTMFQGFVLFTDNAGGVPVELFSFTAAALNGKVNLSWTTATELNNLGFEVERKSDDAGWRTVGFVDGKGTSTEIQNYSFIDDLFGVTESRLSYRLKQIDFNGTYDYSEEIEVERTPATFSLEQNYPNPFNPTTKIKYSIPLIGTQRAVSVQIKVYDVLGNEIATLVNEDKQPGTYEIKFDASGLPSGIYFYKLQAGDFIKTRKMVLLK